MKAAFGKQQIFSCADGKKVLDKPALASAGRAGRKKLWDAYKQDFTVFIGRRVYQHRLIGDAGIGFRKYASGGSDSKDAFIPPEIGMLDPHASGKDKADIRYDASRT